MDSERWSVSIRGLACGGGGALTLERTLASVRGMIEVYVNPATETVYVEFNPEVLPFAELLAMIEHAGYGTAAPTRLAGKGRVARNPEVGGRRR